MRFRMHPTDDQWLWPSCRAALEGWAGTDTVGNDAISSYGSLEWCVLLTWRESEIGWRDEAHFWGKMSAILVKDRTTSWCHTVVVIVRASLCKPCLFAGITRHLCYAFVPPLAVGKTGILLFLSPLGSPIISSCTIDLVIPARKCKSCRNKYIIPFIVRSSLPCLTAS
jgi:hypothetical protein